MGLAGKGDGGGGGSVCSHNTMALFDTTAHAAVFISTTWLINPSL